MSSETIKSANWRGLLVDYCGIFSEESWNDIVDKTKTITGEVFKDSRQIHVYLNVWAKGNKRFLSRRTWQEIKSLKDSKYRKHVFIFVQGYRWNAMELERILKESLLIEAKIKIGDNDDVTISPGDAEKYVLVNGNGNIGLIRSIVEISFKKNSEIFLDSHCSGIVKTPVPSREKTFNNDSFPKGDFCCFALEKKVGPNGKSKYKAGFSNNKDFLWLSIANRKDDDGEAEELYGQLEIDQWYTCSFSLNKKDSRFADSLDGFLKGVVPIEGHARGIGGVTRLDMSEFGHAYVISSHSKNSAFDGLYNAKEIVNEAVARGHKVVGLTDLGSVQSFAEFESAVNAAGIKGLYGVELEIIHDKSPILIGGFENRWLDIGLRMGGELCEGWDGVSYCVFDIETTGLNPMVDEIIQVSAKKFYFVASCFPGEVAGFTVKAKRLDMEDISSRGFREVEVFDQYVKIERKIADHIVSLTGITEEKLNSEGKSVVEVLKSFKEFAKGSILVAHNGGDFDIPFINAHLRRNGMKELEETSLDTLKLSHYLFRGQKFKSHSLSALSKKASILYEEDKAHNALYDVDILSELLFCFLLYQLRNQEAITVDKLKGLNDYFWNQESHNKSVWGDKALVYVKNQSGVKELYELVSLAHTKYYYDSVKLSRSEFTPEKRENLLVVSDPLSGEIIGAVLKDDRELFRNLVVWYDYVTIPPISHFKHHMARNMMEEEDVRRIIGNFVAWCKEDGAKWFFSGSVRYIDFVRDAERYSVLVNTKGISGRRHYLYSYKGGNDVFPDLSFRYTSEFLDEYRSIWKEDEWRELVMESMDNQRSFVDSIDSDIEVIKKALYPAKIEHCNEDLRKLCEKNLKSKYGDKIHEFLLERYNTEINSLVENDFCVVYWVSYLLVKKSIEEGYLVGSRGSVGSSFVAYLMNISEVNPLPPHYYCRECSYFELQNEFIESGFDLPDKKCPGCGNDLRMDGHNIPFETFLGFGGNKVPDIDLNFSGEYQLKAHDFLKQYFGEDRVFRAGTIGTMAEKTAMAVVEEYASQRNMFMSKGKKVWLAEKIIDVKRTTGQHPGGILVVPEDKSIYEFSPTNFPANDLSSSWKTTHLAFEDLHDALLKFDILGHDDPTTLKILKELTGVDPLSISFKDEEIVNLYRSCEAMKIKSEDLIGNETTGALGLPEFGTLSTRKIIRACQPSTFADLMRISGFSHGTGVWKGNIEKLVEDKVNYPLNKVITCRDDIMLYLMRAGLDREDAFNITESIRKGKGLSIDHETLMREKGIPEWYINSSKKITYIFPKAHATAYVMMSWKIAYYKLHYPLAFYAAYFTTSLDSFDLDILVQNDVNLIKTRYKEISSILKSPATRSSVKAKDKQKLVVYEVACEFMLRGFKFSNVCVNKSQLNSFVIDDGSLRIPLMAVDGLGEHLAQGIVAGRKNQFYRNILDLNQRGGIKGVSMSKLQNKGILPKDVESGRDIFDENGHSLF